MTKKKVKTIAVIIMIVGVLIFSGGWYLFHNPELAMSEIGIKLEGILSETGEFYNGGE